MQSFSENIGHFDDQTFYTYSEIALYKINMAKNRIVICMYFKTLKLHWFIRSFPTRCMYIFDEAPTTINVCYLDTSWRLTKFPEMPTRVLSSFCPWNASHTQSTTSTTTYESYLVTVGMEMYIFFFPSSSTPVNALSPRRHRHRCAHLLLLGSV